MISHSSLIGERIFANVIRPVFLRRLCNTAGRSFSSVSGDDSSTKGGPQSVSSDSSSTSNAASKGGFIKAMAKIEGHENFPRAIKNSPFVQMGDPQGKIAEGTIVHVVDNDLYIDFGGKFNCVCPRPHKNGSVYTLGKKVRIMIHDLELSTRFLGAESDLTILEADCTLLGLARREQRQIHAQPNS